MMSLVVSVEDLETGARSQFAFMRSPVRIGRSELNDLPLPQPFVSTMHAVVQFDDSQVRYADLGSTNGSRVNETRLETNAPVLLEPGTEVIIGKLRLTFARRTAPERTAAAAPMATLFAMRAAELPGGIPPAEPAPLPPPLPEAPDEEVEPLIAAASLDLDLAYAEYRGTWEHLRSHVEGILLGLDPATRAGVVRRLAQKYSAIAAEPQFQELAGAVARPASRPRAAAAEGSSGTLLLKTFAESYLPASARVERREEIDAFLKQLAEALETACRSFVEMRKGYEEFGKEMGVRTVQGDGPIERARDARQVLSYLLDPGHPGRAADLQRAFADLMVHQVALLNGVVEGAKALLRRIGPEAVAAEAPRSIWPGPLRAQALWKAYGARFHDIYDEEGAITDALFGPEFAKAYRGMVGQHDEPGVAKGGVGPSPGDPRRRGR
jgi:type VI secretion system protein ImpI